MITKAQCGTRAPAQGHTRYCTVCDALESVPQDGTDSRPQINAIFDRCERIAHAHRQYRQKRRHW